jgi:hypothetical protein
LHSAGFMDHPGPDFESRSESVKTYTQVIPPKIVRNKFRNILLPPSTVALKSFMEVEKEFFDQYKVYFFLTVIFFPLFYPALDKAWTGSTHGLNKYESETLVLCKLL